MSRSASAGEHFGTDNLGALAVADGHFYATSHRHRRLLNCAWIAVAISAGNAITLAIIYTHNQIVMAANSLMTLYDQ